ncbi:MAG: DoxX family protein [Gammaproteobacteria bacterium]|nr:DoxX family protein [Gammaproteobacteria bacterium]
MKEKTKMILLILGAVVLAAVLLMFGVGKFMDPAKWIEKFTVWGLPEWFVPVSGALEIAGAVGLLILVLRGLAGLGLALFVVGAAATHVVHAEIMMIVVASAILVGSAAVGWFRIPETMAFLRRGDAGPD